MEIDLGHIILAIVAGTAIYRWLRTRHLLYRVTEKTDTLLRAQGLCSLNLFRSRKMRRSLALHTLANRLEERIDRLLDSQPETHGSDQALHETRREA